MSVGDLRIRRGEAGDAAAINDIYNHYIRETAITFDIEEWALARREAWLAGFEGHPRHTLLVAEAAGRVTGFACTREYRPKAAYETTVETTIYLAPGEHRRGTGRRLYTALFAAVAGADIHSFVAGITLPNPASVGLHEAFGFRRLGTYHEVGRKFGRYWDVAWFERLNLEAAPAQAAGEHGGAHE
jgi:phosphinothricin acetyltransferase